MSGERVVPSVGYGDSISGSHTIGNTWNWHVGSTNSRSLMRYNIYSVLHYVGY